MATVSIKLNNSQCGKSVKNIKLDLHRTITATGKDEQGNEHTFKDEQAVMHGKFPCNVPSKCKVVDEAQFGITLAIVRDNNTEKGRATVLYDLETGAPNLFNTHKWDTELIPSMDTPNIKVSYTIEMGVWHDGAFQSVQEIPSVHFPLWIARDPKG